jgi:hypothetical protein
MVMLISQYVFSGLFFHCLGKGPMPYNFGEKSVVSSLKGNEKKTDVKLLFGENCRILKKFSEGKAPINGPY